MSATQILALNPGSSSLRVAGFAREAHDLVARGRVRLEGHAHAPFARLVEAAGLSAPTIVAYRVVHGGARFSAPCVVDDAVAAAIAQLGALAPLHNPVAAALLGEGRRALPEARHVAVFDTAFFADLPEASRGYAIPPDLVPGARRYGFHGLAHAANWRAWSRATGRDHGRLVSFQLGSGCSAAAIRDGRPLDTSMGYTPMEGLVMATRAGDLDPGLILAALRRPGARLDELDRALDTRAGLLGLSGRSGNVRDLLRERDPRGDRALDAYCWRARKYLGAYLAVLGGADAVVFSGGVGEHAPEIRARIAEGAAFCGLELDRAANQRGVGREPTRIDAGGAIAAWINPLDEEREMAEAAALVA